MTQSSPDGDGRLSASKAEAALGRLTQRLRVALTNSPTAVWEQDLDLRYTWIFNPKLGYAAEEVIGRTDFDLIEAGAAERLAKIKLGVMRTGRPARDRVEAAAIGGPVETYDLYVEPSYDKHGVLIGVMCSATDITAGMAAEARLREREALLSFLLKLSDVLRDLADPAAVLIAAGRTLGEHLGAGRVAFAEDAGDGVHFDIIGDWTDGAPSLAGRYRYDDFGQEQTADLRAGRTLSRPDIATDARISPEHKATYAAFGIAATLKAPISRQGRCIAILAVHYAEPHAFGPHEIALAEATAERIWAAIERARSEAARAESEARFAQFAAASSAGLWIRDAASFALEYASPAVNRLYGLASPRCDAHDLADLVAPEHREDFTGRLEKAKRGETYVNEFQVRRANDGARRWLRSTVFPLRGADGRVTRIGGFTEDITAARRALDRQEALASELQHRVRNSMALIRSLVARTAEHAENAADLSARLDGRLLALSRVQARLTRAADESVTLAEIVRDETAALAPPDGRLVYEGPAVALAPKAAETLTLALHELATNAVKHGAFSPRGGRAVVTWRLVERDAAPWLVLDWREQGVALASASAPSRRGFGAELIERRIPYELRGAGHLTFRADGVHCRLEFPLRPGASVFDTRAPRFDAVEEDPAMSDQPSLDGRRVLVIEDDYYLADDMARALREYGAEILGPCADADAALAALSGARPHVAVVDVNLGDGPNFRVAHGLRKAGLPFVFMTGYDAGVIPADFAGVARLEKPVEIRRLVEALAAASSR